ncbi:MAG: glycosyltransferase family 4 protein, partial [Anaerolineae bacterium]|nr:glycosyltransferase family 4 protein [Anaerolineae bacterium]
SMITGLGFAFSDQARQSVRFRLISQSARGLYRLALRCNTKVFFQNPDDRSLFLALNLAKEDQMILINGSGVDVDHFSVTPLPSEEITFLLIARLIQDKGIYEYAKAAAQLKAKYRDIVFQLLGPFDHHPQAVKPSNVSAWKGTISYCGETSDVRPFIKRCSVYVLPSYREGTPRTVLEAMAMGRPIITTDAPGCRETVRDGENGLLVPVRDVDALVAGMEYFIRNPQQIARMGQRSREIAEERYDVHKVNAVIMETMQLL